MDIASSRSSEWQFAAYDNSMSPSGLPKCGGISMRGRAAQVFKSFSSPKSHVQPQFYISRSSSPMT